MTVCFNQLFKIVLWAIFNVFIEFITILLLLYVLVFGPEAFRILAPQPGIRHALLALEGEILPTGPPGKSQLFFYFFN